MVFRIQWKDFRPQSILHIVHNWIQIRFVHVSLLFCCCLCLWQAYHVTDAALGYFSPKQSHNLSILRLQSCWELTNHGIVNIGEWIQVSFIFAGDLFYIETNKGFKMQNAVLCCNRKRKKKQMTKYLTNYCIVFLWNEYLSQSDQMMLITWVLCFNFMFNCSTVQMHLIKETKFVWCTVQYLCFVWILFCLCCRSSCFYSLNYAEAHREFVNSNT